jgi:diadenosine tetraphosphate (Ap4A) HIT family hydrolase
MGTMNPWGYGVAVRRSIDLFSQMAESGIELRATSLSRRAGLQGDSIECVNAIAWRALVDGVGCQLDAPRPTSNDFWDLVAPLSVSSLYLAKNQTYRGQCSLIFDLRHAARPDQLTSTEWGAFCADLYAAQRAIVSVTQPDHVNVESLGNVVPHLHWHIIPRYIGDPRWGMPIWTTPLSEMLDTRLDAGERETLLRQLRDALR